MRIVTHVHSYYDWEPLPPDVPVYDTSVAVPVDGVAPFTKDFQKALQKKQVKPAQGGQWLMRVTRKRDTHVLTVMTEEEIVETMIAEMNRGDRQYLTRLQAVARNLARHVFPNHAHKSHMEEFEVHDDGAETKLFDRLVGAHVDAGNIEPEDAAKMREAYLEPIPEGAHVEFFHGHFGVSPEATLRSRARRALARAAEEERVKKHHETMAAKVAAEGVTP